MNDWVKRMAEKMGANIVAELPHTGVLGAAHAAHYYRMRMEELQRQKGAQPDEWRISATAVSANEGYVNVPLHNIRQLLHDVGAEDSAFDATVAKAALSGMEPRWVLLSVEGISRLLHAVVVDKKIPVNVRVSTATEEPHFEVTVQRHQEGSSGNSPEVERHCISFTMQC